MYLILITHEYLQLFSHAESIPPKRLTAETRINLGSAMATLLSLTRDVYVTSVRSTAT